MPINDDGAIGKSASASDAEPRARKRTVIVAVCGVAAALLVAGVVLANRSTHHNLTAGGPTTDASHATATTSSTQSTRPTASASPAPTTGPTSPAAGPKQADGSTGRMPGAPDERRETTAPVSAPSQSTNPQASDFIGTVTISPTSTASGESVNVALTIRNITGHVVETSNAKNPHGVGLVCTSDLTADGHTNEPLVFGTNFWFDTGPPLAPGETGGSGPWYLTPTHTGQIVCEGVIIASPDNWTTVISLARLTNVSPASLTVTG